MYMDCHYDTPDEGDNWTPPRHITQRSQTRPADLRTRQRRKSDLLRTLDALIARYEAGHHVSADDVPGLTVRTRTGNGTTRRSPYYKFIYHNKAGQWYYRFSDGGDEYKSGLYATDHEAAQAYNNYVAAHGMDWRETLNTDQREDMAS